MLMRTSMMLAIALLLSCSASLLGEDRHDTKSSTLSVSGRAVVTAQPDRAVVRLGAVAQSEEAAAAQQAINEVMHKAIASLRELDVDERRIQTAGLSLMPVYDMPRPNRDEPHEPRIVAYRASNTLRVEVDDLSLVGPVIDAGVEAGANQVESISFELRDDAVHRRRALQAAVRNAKDKAQAMASALGVQLRQVAEVSEAERAITPVRMGMARMEAMAMDTATPVQPGELTIEAVVTLRYHLEEASTAVTTDANDNAADDSDAPTPIRTDQAPQ